MATLSRLLGGVAAQAAALAARRRFAAGAASAALPASPPWLRQAAPGRRLALTAAWPELTPLLPTLAATGRLLHTTRGCPFGPPPPPDGGAQAAAAVAEAAPSASDAPASVVAPLATPTPAGAPGGAAPAAAAAQDTLYSMRQVSKHSTEESCWIVVDGEVFDVTSYLDDHPGGAESILLNAGVDCTDEFNPIHSEEAKQLLRKFRIGAVAGAAKKPAPAVAAAAAAAPSPPAAAAAATAATAAAAAAAPVLTAEAVMAEVRELRPPPPAPAAVPSVRTAADAALAAAPVFLADPRARYDLPLASSERLNHDTYLMRFALPSPAHRVGLPCGKHVFMFADIDGELVARAYTPLSSDRDLGRLDLLIKVYWANEHPLFPAGGKMSQHLAKLKPGDTISVKGPMGKFEYTGGGGYTLNRRKGQAKWMSFVAGGSGITPCYAVVREVLADPSDTTRCALLYANKKPNDIWLKAELDALAAAHPDRFYVRYILEQPPPGWAGSSGRVTLDMLAQHLYPPGPSSLTLMCGPPPMLEGAVVPGLKALGYQAGAGGSDRDDMVVF